MEKLMQFVLSYKKTVGGFFLGVILTSLAITTVPQKAQAGPILILIAVVVTAVVVYDALSCDFNIIFTCPGGPGGPGGSPGGGPTGTPGGGPTGSPTGNPTGSPTGNPTGSPTGNPIGPTACSSVTANTCGMHGTGFVINGVCSATAPADSACPVPTFGNFSANPSLVKKGEPTTLGWSASAATVCGITGGNLSLPNLGITGTQTTGAITQKTVFTLTCKNGLKGPSNSESATVNIIPVLKEI